MQLVEGYFFDVNCFKLSEASLLVLAESRVNAGRPRGRNTEWCSRLTSLQESGYRRMQKEQLWLNWTNRWTNLILTCLGPLDFFSDDELLLTETDLTEQTETNEEILIMKTETKTQSGLRAKTWQTFSSLRFKRT